MSVRRSVSTALFLAITLGAASASHAAEKEIKLGTLFPKTSVEGKVLQTWQADLATKSQGALKLTVFWSGSQGEEGAMVEKLKSGSQLDAVLVTAVGLSKIWHAILVLQSPGLFRTWAALDQGRDSMKADIDTNFTQAGTVMLGPVDVGMVHVMSKGAEIRGPETLQGRSPYMWSDDMIAPLLYRTIGGVSPKPLSMSAVRPALNASSVDVVLAPALTANQFQWASMLDNMVTQVVGVSIGGIVIKKSVLDALSPEQQKTVRDTGAAAAKKLTDRIRQMDTAAFESLKKSMKTTTTLTPEEEEMWNDVFRRTREALKQGVFDPALLNRLEALPD